MNVSKCEKEHRQKLLGDCSEKIEQLQTQTENKVQKLEETVQEVRQNYNWQIEDLNTKIENRVDLQFLETTIESLNQSVVTRASSGGPIERHCIFSGKVKYLIRIWVSSYWLMDCAIFQNTFIYLYEQITKSYEAIWLNICNIAN